MNYLKKNLDFNKMNINKPQKGHQICLKDSSTCSALINLNSNFNFAANVGVYTD